MRYPEYLCRICGGASISDFKPCTACQDEIDYQPKKSCSICGIDLAGSDNPCTACRSIMDISRKISCVLTLGNWQGPLREWLSIYKYGGDVRMADFLAERLFSAIERQWPGIPLVPVPPRPIRLKKEGFDPVGAIADRIEKKGRPVYRLLRRRGKSTQKGRSRSDRLTAGALDYRMIRKVNLSGSSLIIFDDVTTTGTTLETCAKILSESGAGTLVGLAICRD